MNKYKRYNTVTGYSWGVVVVPPYPPVEFLGPESLRQLGMAVLPDSSQKINNLFNHAYLNDKKGMYFEFFSKF